MLFITHGRSVSFWECAYKKKSQSDKGVPNWNPRNFSMLRFQKCHFLNFQGAFSVNKYEGKCSFSFFFYSISGVRSARYNLYGKKGKTVTTSRKLQAKGDTSSLQTGKQLTLSISLCLCMCRITRELDLSSVRHLTI